MRPDSHKPVPTVQLKFLFNSVVFVFCQFKGFVISYRDAANATLLAIWILSVLDGNLSEKIVSSLDVEDIYIVLELFGEFEGARATILFILKSETDEVAMVQDLFDRVFQTRLWRPPEIGGLWSDVRCVRVFIRGFES